MAENLTSQEPVTEEPQAGGRNLLLVFAGFLLLGAATALLLFGGQLFAGDRATEDDGTILDQVGAFPTLESSVAQIPSISQASGILDVGEQAYNFTLSDLDGNLVSLADFRGQPVVVNFWATWCAPCRIEMPELQAAYDKYQDDGLVILALDQDEPAHIAKAYFHDEMGLTFTPLLDQGSVIATTYGGYGILPSTYFIDREGIVSAIHRGPLTMSQIEGYLAETLPNI